MADLRKLLTEIVVDAETEVYQTKSKPDKIKEQVKKLVEKYVKKYERILA